jgi:ankyrin repeat protein
MNKLIAFFASFLLTSIAVNAQFSTLFGIDWTMITPQELQSQLESGFDVSQIDRDYGTITPLFVAASQSDDPDIIQTLIDYGADVSATNEYGTSVVMYGASNDNPQIIQTLIDNGADVTHVNDRGYSAFYRALQNGNLEIVQLILDNGVSLSERLGDPLCQHRFRLELS